MQHRCAGQCTLLRHSLPWQVPYGFFRPIVKEGVAGIEQLNVCGLEVRRSLSRKAPDLEVGDEGLEDEVFRVQHLRAREDTPAEGGN